MFISLTQFSVFSATLRESTGILTCQEHDAMLQATAFALVLLVRFLFLTTYTHVDISLSVSAFSAALREFTGALTCQEHDAIMA